MSYATLHKSISSSSLIMEPVEARWLFAFMLSQADRTGYVPGSPVGLAHQANLPIEVTREMLVILESPDADSRTPDKEGRRIEKVDGGWRIVNYEKYRGNSLYGKRAEANSNSNNGHTHDRDEAADLSRGRDTNSKNTIVASNSNSNSTTHVRAIAQLDESYHSTTPDSCPIAQLETFSGREREIFGGLASGTKRKLFLIVRDWAEQASKNGEPDFQVAQGYLAKTLRCDQQYVSKIIKEFRDLGIIDQTVPYVFKQSPARYRWAIETTISVPEYEGVGHETGEEILDL